MRPDPGGSSDDRKLSGFGSFGPSDKYLIGSPIGWRKALQALSHGGRQFRLGVVTALALCNHSLTLKYVDGSMLRHRVK
jgi:hypothetical protein